LLQELTTRNGRRTRKARFELVMKADPPLWPAEQDAEEEAQDYQQKGRDPSTMSIKLDNRAERIHRI
jgi:hypothetical protein